MLTIRDCSEITTAGGGVKMAKPKHWQTLDTPPPPKPVWPNVGGALMHKVCMSLFGYSLSISYTYYCSVKYGQTRIHVIGFG